jgi:S1-C subfamily serine protease
LVFVPFDDGDDDDTPVGGSPPPPDDRLWRHPSELGSSFSSAFTGSAAASDASGTRLWAVAVVAGLIGSALSLGVVAVAGRLSTDVVEKPVVERVAVRPVAELSLASTSGQGVIAIAKSVAPTIARIESTADGGKTIASAILVRTDGYLATNAHVVATITSVLVVLSDGTELTGRVVGIDAMTDIAILKVDRDQLPVAVLGSATALQPGEPAIAIGSPIGSSGGPSVTVGVISALGRHVSSSDGVELHDMIQTDAPTAVGSSGGALCDGSGAVIGMTTAISTSTDLAATALGYAIPVDIVRAVADDIIATGTARHSWLGVEGADLDTAIAKDIGVTGGAKVTKVIDNSPAALAGLQSDDVITGLDGAKVTSMSAFVVALRGHHPGDSITLEIRRGLEPRTMVVTLGERNA